MSLEDLNASRSTLTAYRARWELWRSWCTIQGVVPFPADPDRLVIYLTQRFENGLALATVRGDVAAIAAMHRVMGPGGSSPTLDAHVTRFLASLAKSAPAQKKARAFTLSELDIMLEHLLAKRSDDLIMLRDRAILLAGLALRLRPSQLVGLDWSDLEDTAEGIGIQDTVLPRIGGHRCPVVALRAWKKALLSNGAELGPLFVSVTRGGAPKGRLSGRGITNAVQRISAACELGEGFSGQSLRLGMDYAMLASPRH